MSLSVLMLMLFSVSDVGVDVVVDDVDVNDVGFDVVGRLLDNQLVSNFCMFFFVV